MKKIVHSKTLCLFLSLILILNTAIYYTSASALAAEKIDFELQEIMNSAEEDDEIPVIIWMSDIEHTDIEEATKNQTLSTHNNVSFVANNYNDSEINIAECGLLDEYIELKRSKTRETYASANLNKFNNIFPEKVTTLFRTTEQEQPSIDYVSVYSPTVQLKLNKEQIQQASNSSEVEMIYYDPPIEVGGDCMDTSLEITKTKYVRDTLGFKGDGIKIGQIEDYVPTPDSTNFTVSRIHIDSSAPASSSSVHAEMVASIMVGKTGIVPNASLYCTSIQRTGGWRAGIEWLLSQGVHVINISNTLLKQTGVYGEHSRWIDHIAIQHDVHVVIAAGNYSSSNPDAAVTEAAMGNNVICVGAINDGNSTSASNHTFASYSLYVTHTYKPDICAPGTAIKTPYGEASGTSLAAPHVTAAVAQLCQQKELLKTRQDLVKSILLAGTREFEGTSASGSGNNTAMQYKYGSGMLDAKNSRYVNNSIRYRAGTLTSGVTSLTHQFTVTSSDDFIRVCLSWLRNNRCSTGTHQTEEDISAASLAQMTLTVTAPNGSTIWRSSDTRGSVQLVAFEPTQTGTYTITIQRTTQTNTSTHFAIAFY